MEAALVGSYDYRLVALSVLIAMLASYAALDLGGRVTASHGRLQVIWLMGGSVAMGIGHLVDALHRHARLQTAGYCLLQLAHGSCYPSWRPILRIGA